MPAKVDPVNEIIFISGCDDIKGPISDPTPLMQLKHPFGKEVLSIISIRIRLLREEYSLGFKTIEQPAAIAEDIFVRV